jgi:hypothetical protein
MMKKFSKISINFVLIVLIIGLCSCASTTNESSDAPTINNSEVTSDNYSNTSSSYSDSSSKILCAATPCPNYAVTGSSYCAVHKSGKTNTCIECGKAIWADETYCDECLLGTNLSGSPSDSIDYDENGNYQPIEDMTQEEIDAEFEYYFGD